MSDHLSDTTSRRARALVVEAARAAYGPERHEIRCGSCGSATDTVDGYEVSTPFGAVRICADCNRDPLLWDAAEVFFLGARTSGGNAGSTSHTEVKP